MGSEMCIRDSDKEGQVLPAQRYLDAHGRVLLAPAVQVVEDCDPLHLVQDVEADAVLKDGLGLPGNACVNNNVVVVVGK